MTPSKRPRLSGHINDLPEEMLEQILDYLPMADRKEASLVCTRWSLGAFSPRFLNQSVNLVITIRHPTVSCQDVEAVLSKSSRCYRNLLVTAITSGYPECTESDMDFLLTILSKYGENVNSFTGQRLEYSPERLRRILHKMPNLKRLSTEVTTGPRSTTENDPKVFPVLTKLQEWDSGRTRYFFQIEGLDLLQTAPNINSLSIFMLCAMNDRRSQHTMDVIGPQLKYLKLMSQCSPVQFNPIDFGQLKTLILDARISDVLLSRLLGGMPKLKKLAFKVNLKMDCLQVICQRCSELRIFTMITFDMQVGIFRCFENLKNLEVLEVIGFLNCGSLADCAPLPRVKALNFRFYKVPPDITAFLALVNQIFPSLELLKVKGSYCSPIHSVLIKEICDTFGHVRELIFDDCRENGNPDEVIAGPFTGQQPLQELTLKRLNVEVDSLPGCNLRRLKLHQIGNLTIEIIQQIGELYPQLRFMELIECGNVERKDIAAIRRILPNCVLHIP